MPTSAPALSVSERLGCQAVVGASLLPMLWLLPLATAAPLSALCLAHVLYTGQRRLGRWLHLALDVFLVAFALVAASATPMADVRAAGMAALLAAVSSHTTTVRQGLLTLNLAFIGVFASLNLPGGWPWMIWCGGVVLLAIGQNQRLMAREIRAIWTPRHAGRLLARALAWSLPLAAVFFVLSQSLSHSLAGLRMAPRVSKGLDARMSPDSLGARLSNPATAFRVFFQDPPPANPDLYWRSSVLWDFNGQSWTRPEWANAAVKAPKYGTPQWHYRVEPADQRLQVSLEHARTPNGEGGVGWTRDRVMVLPAGAPFPAATWWEAAPPAAWPTGHTLTHQEQAAALFLPTGLNPRTEAMAQAWRKAYPDPQVFVARTLDWFSHNLEYSVDAPAHPGMGMHEVDDFLFSRRRGYCQHFSSSFAVIMRAAGIPSRVIVGYQGGTPHTWADYWRVREMDAHAWVEIWQEDKGWIRVDPTAAVSGAPGVPSWWRRWLANDALDWMDERIERLFSDLKQAGQSSWLGRLAWDRWVWVLLPLGLAVSGWVGWRLWRKRGPATPAERDWRALERRLTALIPGGQRRAHEGTDSHVQRLAPLLAPDSRAELRALAEGWQNLRYGTSGTGVIGWAARVRRYRPLGSSLTSRRPTPHP